MPATLISKQAEAILRGNKLSLTHSRKSILAAFLQEDPSALSHADLESLVADTDRVTIYRTLHTFSESGIIHSISSADGSLRYALCKGECEQGHHHDDHVHFRCNKCGQTQCLEKIIIPEVAVPKGFRVEKKEMVMEGVCARCR